MSDWQIGVVVGISIWAVLLYAAYRLIRALPGIGRKLRALALERKAETAYADALGGMIDRGSIDEIRMLAIGRQFELADTSSARARASQRVLDARVQQMVKDGRLSDADEAEISKLSGMLKLEPGQATRAAMATARRLYAVEQRPLEPVPTGYHLEPGEQCYATILAEASEIRTRTVTTMDYRGTSWGFTGDNFAWNRGSVRVHNRDKDYVASFGSGQLAITDRRLMIALPNDTFSIAYSSIVQVDSFPDGLKIHPSSGKPLMLSYRNDPTIAVVLARCLAGGAPLAAAPAGNPRGQ